MNDNSNPNYFSAWWALVFIFLTLNLFPIPFAILISFLGDWVYSNPVIVEMNYLGQIKMHPIADNLTSIVSMIFIVAFIVWRMKVRNLPLSELGSLRLKRKDLLYGTAFLVLFVLLEECYMLILGLEMPEGFIAFMLSDPLILGLLSLRNSDFRSFVQTLHTAQCTKYRAQCRVHSAQCSLYCSSGDRARNHVSQ